MLAGDGVVMSLAKLYMENPVQKVVARCGPDTRTFVDDVRFDIMARELGTNVRLAESVFRKALRTAIAFNNALAEIGCVCHLPK